ncbi:hypothetical protein [Asanoa siamensis]|uniref:Uncharacterized protein n=1 Tax=Asanoa siamensis TaxID=926357 RepID=A0ABQ4CT16_9ACTN|nr:hypothetical protein [Asanoa siamensis]GIF74412.1 hypothetical protein Asi02nite_39300 [Asanoa siamensis]
MAVQQAPAEREPSGEDDLRDLVTIVDEVVAVWCAQYRVIHRADSNLIFGGTMRRSLGDLPASFTAWLTGLSLLEGIAVGRLVADILTGAVSLIKKMRKRRLDISTVSQIAVSPTVEIRRLHELTVYWRVTESRVSAHLGPAPGELIERVTLLAFMFRTCELLRNPERDPEKAIEEILDCAATAVDMYRFRQSADRFHTTPVDQWIKLLEGSEDSQLRGLGG